MNVLVLNAGSSSLKFQIISTDLERINQDQDEHLCRGAVKQIGADAEFVVESEGRPRHSRKAPVPDIQAALEAVLQWLTSDGAGIPGISSAADIHAVGHRVVHGGELFSESAIITGEVLRGIRDCVDLAPLHNPRNIEGIEAAQRFVGSGVPQVAVFDTAFHHKMPEYAFIYAVPYSFYQKHRLRRYGFHGTSHRYVAYRYRQFTGLSRGQTNVISLHLGNGCSAAAVQAGYPVDTSMGLTPLEGLVMGTRSGDVDPSLASVIAAKEALSADDVDEMLNTGSGLLGISGVSSDMRELQREAQLGHARAQLAIDVFCYRARKYIGAFLAAMGGTDAVIFTGGIGENSPEIRAKICEGLAWTGLRLDTERNGKTRGVEGRIGTDESTLPAFCVPTDEELLIARDTVRCILGVPHPG